VLIQREVELLNLAVRLLALPTAAGLVTTDVSISNVKVIVEIREGLIVIQERKLDGVHVHSQFLIFLNNRIFV